MTNIELPGYKLLHADSTTCAGGVTIYHSISSTADIISNPYLDIIGCENLWIKLNCPDVIIDLIYRHPKNDVKLILQNLNTILEQYNNKKVYIIGDSKIDICTSLNPLNSTHATDYTNTLASNNFFPLISLPTRVIERSSTIIDHIITNDHEHPIFPASSERTLQTIIQFLFY